jgi:hypothetical protein
LINQPRYSDRKLLFFELFLVHRLC